MSFRLILLGTALLVAPTLPATADDSVEQLRVILRSGTGEQRLDALQRLTNITADHAQRREPQPLELVPELLRTIEGAYEIPRGSQDWPRVLPAQAALVLGNIGREALDPVISLLQRPRPRTQFFAARALGHMGPDATDALPALCAAMEGATDRVQVAIIDAIGQIGISTEGALDTVIRAGRNSESAQVRIAAAHALARAQVGIPRAAAALVGLLQGPSMRVAFESLIALGQVGGDVLIVGWKTLSSNTRADVLEELVRRTDPNTDPSEQIEQGELLERLVEHAREFVTADLERERETAGEAAILKKKRNTSGLVRQRRALIILAGRLDMLTDDEIREVRATLRSGDDERVKVALSTMAQIPESAAPMIPELILLLDRTDLSIVEYTLTLMAHMGSAARPAISAISRTAREYEELEAKAKSVIVVIQRGGVSKPR